MNIILAALLALCACKETTGLENYTPVLNEVEAVTLSERKLSLIIGDARILTANVTPWNAKTKKVTWTSSNDEVAKVSDSGTVSALSEGEADIIASAGGKEGVCHVTVSKLFIPIETMEVELAERKLAVGATLAPTVTILPENTTESITWTTSDASVATVADGVVTGVAPGYVDITASAGELSWKRTFLVHPAKLWLEQVDPLTKPVQRTPFEWDRDTICVARGETATVQMVVVAGEDQANNFVPEVVYFAPDGQTSGLAIEPRINHVREVRATDHWDIWCGGAAPDMFDYRVLDIPDALVPQSDYQKWLRKGGYCGVWAEFDIPRDFAPGLYEGLFKVSGDTEATLPFHVKVYDVTLPEKQGLDVLQWANPEVESMAGGETPDYYSVLGTYMPMIVSFVSGYGQNGWRLLYADGSYKCITREVVTNPDTGKKELEVTFDQAMYKREFDMFYENCPDLRQIQGHNIVAARGDGTITLYGYKLNDAGDLWLDTDGNPEGVYVTLPDDDIAPAKYYFRKYFDGLRKMLTSNNLPDGRSWMDVYVQTLSDEPDDKMAPAYNMLTAMVKEVAPDIRVLDPVQSDLINTRTMDIPCPDERKVATLPRQEGQICWMYNCMGPQGNWANRFIRIPLLKTRIVNWLNYHYDTQGFLHWGLNYWVGAKDEDPWKDAYGSYIAGDMWIIWPGDHKVYSSIRLCAMRDGIRDFDLLRMIEKRSKADADAFCARLVLDSEAPSYDMDVHHFRALRKDMLEYLAK